MPFGCVILYLLCQRPSSEEGNARNHVVAICLATKIKRRKRYWKLISRDKKEKNGMNDYFFPLGQQTQLFELWFRRQVPGMKIS